jgi:hypothetical protein
MYCRYCRAKNRSSAEECIVCGKPFPKEGRQSGVTMSAPPPQPRQASHEDESPTVPRPDTAAPPPNHSNPSNPSSPSPFVHMTIDPEEYARRFPDRDFRHRSPARKAARFFGFALAWVTAIAAGALGARWVDDNGGAEAALRRLMAGATRTGIAQTPVPVAKAPGKSELPYEGASPAAATHAPLRATQAIEKPAEVSSGASEVKAAPDVPPDAAPDAQPDPVPKAPAPKAAKAAEKIAAEQQPVKTVKPKKSSSATQKVARGREISRIQQQAADELKKKTRKRRARLEQAKQTQKASQYASPRQRHVRQVLARCEKLDGVFWREQCKWRVCDGQWGRNGCPSYTRDKLAVD